MNLEEIFTKARSYRRFYQNELIEQSVLKKFVNLARLSSSAKNVQPLKYYISNDNKQNEDIFKCLTWAGYLTNWDGPEEGEKPSAYIVIVGDKRIAENIKWDDSIAAHSILLGATEKGFGGCIIAAINKDELKAKLKLTEDYNPMLVVALGKPKEIVIIDEIQDGKYKYWRDDAQNHHVPKRSLDEIIISK